MAHERLIAELDNRRDAARGMGGPEKLAQRKKRGQLSAQERLDALIDPGSFIEVGLLGASAIDLATDETPRDAKLTGFGRIDGRDVGVVINDFTVNRRDKPGHDELVVIFRQSDQISPPNYFFRCLAMKASERSQAILVAASS